MEMIVDFLGVLEELYPESVRAHLFNDLTVAHSDQVDAHERLKHGTEKRKSARRKIVTKNVRRELCTLALIAHWLASIQSATVLIGSPLGRATKSSSLFEDSDETRRASATEFVSMVYFQSGRNSASIIF